MKSFKPIWLKAGGGLLFAALALPAAAQTPVPASAVELPEADVSDLTDLSLEELLGLEVTVASRTP